jgi:hypothetical protein
MIKKFIVFCNQKDKEKLEKNWRDISVTYLYKVHTFNSIILKIQFNASSIMEVRGFDLQQRQGWENRGGGKTSLGWSFNTVYGHE